MTARHSGGVSWQLREGVGRLSLPEIRCRKTVIKDLQFAVLLLAFPADPVDS
jgi:hypothetical protein